MSVYFLFSEKTFFIAASRLIKCHKNSVNNFTGVTKIGNGTMFETPTLLLCCYYKKWMEVLAEKLKEFVHGF